LRRRQIIYSPGLILPGNVIVEQIEDEMGEYAYAVKPPGKPPYISPTVDVGDVTYLPMRKVPWSHLPGPPMNYGSEEKLQQKAERYIEEHVDIAADKRFYTILSCWIMATWVWERFNSFGYLWFHGPSGSGKTWAMEILGSISYRPLMSSSISPAALYRCVEFFSPTFMVDEAERLGIGKLSESDSILKQILNAGYRRGFPAIRAKAKTEEIVIYNVYGFKALASIHSLPETLERRSIRVPMAKATRRVKMLIDREEAKRLASMLLMYRFNHLFDPPPVELNLFTDILDGTIIEIFKPLTVVAPTEQVKQRIVGFARDLYRERLEEEKTGLEASVFNALHSLVSEGVSYIPVRDVAARFNEDVPEGDRISASFCGKVLKRLGFKKRRTTGGRVAVIVDVDLIKRLKSRYGVPEQKREQRILEGRLGDPYTGYCELCGRDGVGITHRVRVGGRVYGCCGRCASEVEGR